MVKVNWLEFWYEALVAEEGIVVAVSDVPKAIQRLYQARAKSGDPDLAGLAIRKSPTKPTEEVWLVKVEAKAKEPPDGQEISHPAREA